MKLACPYCGTPIGDGAPTHLTPVRYMPTGVSTTFKMIPVEQILSGAPRPTEVRAIQSCPADACKVAAAHVVAR